MSSSASGMTASSAATVRAERGALHYGQAGNTADMRENNTSSAHTILVVDDEPVVLSFLTGTLSRYGYRVVQAESGAQAIRICRDRGHTIDLLLTDVVMPGLNGRELVDAIRCLGLEPHTLFMSGYSKDVALHRGISDWAHFIQKPFTPSQLVEKVREVLAHAGTRANAGVAD